MAREARNTRVISKKLLTPNMVRLTLGGDDLENFPEGYEGGYIKVVVESTGTGIVSHSFTVREFDPEQLCLVIDMVAHGDHGPASRWAGQVRVNDEVNILGPGACKRLNQEADWFLLAGDMTALPAISVNLEILPENARGYAVLEVIDPGDQIELNAPKGLEVVWVRNDDPLRAPSPISDTVKNLVWLEGQASTWVAGEFDTSRSLRQYFRHERKIHRDFMYVSCYWKIGDTDEGMKVAKKNDSEAW